VPAIFHQVGSVDHYVRFRRKETDNQTPSWLYLGTAVLSPEADATVFVVPWTADFNAPVPVNEVFCGESHDVLTTVNRLNYDTYNRVRSRNTSAAGSPVVRTDSLASLGKLIRGVDDFELLLKFNPINPADAVAHTSPAGRMYYSARLTNYRETEENTRLVEASLVLYCIPLYVKADKKFNLFTEVEADWGTVPDPE
jgi:hypothetical protein